MPYLRSISEIWSRLKLLKGERKDEQLRRKDDGNSTSVIVRLADKAHSFTICKTSSRLLQQSPALQAAPPGNLVGESDSEECSARIRAVKCFGVVGHGGGQVSDTTTLATRTQSHLVILRLVPRVYNSFTHTFTQADSEARALPGATTILNARARFEALNSRQLITEPACAAHFR